MSEKFALVPADMFGVRKDELNYWLAKLVLEICRKESGDPVLWENSLSNGLRVTALY